MANTNPPLGFRRGRRKTVTYKVAAASADINLGDTLAWSAAGLVAQAADGDPVAGVAMQVIPSPAVDGDTEVLVDISPESLYELAGSTTVTDAMVGYTTDIAGPQSVELTGIPVNNDVFIAEAYPDRGTVLVSFIIDTLGPIA